MDEPVWIQKDALISLHLRTLAQHGGADGVRDDGLLDSALYRPVNRFLYEGVTDISELAATYAIAVAGNHPFVDGNKRAAFQCLTLFLRLNGYRLVADRVDATRTIVALAAGQLQSNELTQWVREQSRPWPAP